MPGQPREPDRTSEVGHFDIEYGPLPRQPREPDRTSEVGHSDIEYGPMPGQPREPDRTSDVLDIRENEEPLPFGQHRGGDAGAGEPMQMAGERLHKIFDGSTVVDSVSDVHATTDAQRHAVAVENAQRSAAHALIAVNDRLGEPTADEVFEVAAVKPRAPRPRRLGRFSRFA
jgi:hypothetical protein